MLADVERIEPALTTPSNLVSAASSQPAGVSFAVANTVSSSVPEVPEWVSRRAASVLLGVSEMHVRILVRDGAFRINESDGDFMLNTADVIEFQKRARAVQWSFAVDAACMNETRRLVVEKSA